MPVPPKKGVVPEVCMSTVVSGTPDSEGYRQLYVCVLAAQGLYHSDTVLPSSYVVVGLKGKQHPAWATKVALDAVDPIYDEEGEVCDYGEEDALEIEVLGLETVDGKPFRYGAHTVSAQELRDLAPPPGCSAESELVFPLDDEGAFMKLWVGLREPPAPPEMDPGLHVTEYDRGPVPFMLRSMDHGRVHRLLGYTRVGRSRRDCDPLHDLVL